MSEESEPPGEQIKRELYKRNWSQGDLATVLGISPNMVSRVISARSKLTVRMAMNLAAAFGTTPHSWMDIEGKYRLNLVAKMMANGVAIRRDRHIGRIKELQSEVARLKAIIARCAVDPNPSESPNNSPASCPAMPEK